jgi:selT/selW/selH-like putative selenoprotein
MEISIHYCGTCNYRPRAAGLMMAIRESFGVTSTLVHSKEIGAFKVIADGETVYSKAATGVFPTHQEIISLLKKRRGPI